MFFSNYKIYDISLNIDTNTIVWPGDTKVKITKNASFENNDNYNLSSIELSLHVGTHIDSPSHFIENADSISDISLDKYFGRAKVIFIDTEKNITKENLISQNIEKDDILLFKTINSLRHQDGSFNKDFIALDISGCQYLVSKKIKAVGIDYLSIEPFLNDNSMVHKTFFSNNIGVIEGLFLKNISPGTYFLICTPLKIIGVEASPARAFLLENIENKKK